MRPSEWNWGDDGRTDARLRLKGSAFPPSPALGAGLAAWLPAPGWSVAWKPAPSKPPTHPAILAEYEKKNREKRAARAARAAPRVEAALERLEKNKRALVAAFSYDTTLGARRVAELRQMGLDGEAEELIALRAEFEEP